VGSGARSLSRAASIAAVAAHGHARCGGGAGHALVWRSYSARTPRRARREPLVRVEIVAVKVDLDKSLKLASAAARP